MPIHPIGQERSINSPYCIRDYKSVGAEFGTRADLRKLTDEAHARGMAVIMDWVANHTAWDHEWMANMSWYTRNQQGDIIHPAGTNWEDVADLNFDNTNMREAMIDAMKYWIIESNIDGFRCDYADGVPFDFWKQVIDSLESIPNRELIFLAEGNRSDHFAAGFQLSFGWLFYGNLKSVFEGESVAELFDSHNEEYQNTPEGKHWLRFTTNHDESAWDATPMEIFNGKDGAIAASVITLFMGGVPLIYGSQEVGATDNIPFFSNSLINWNANGDMKATYRKLLQFYNTSEAARKGKLEEYMDSDIAAFKKRSHTGEELLVLVNTRSEMKTFTVPTEIENSQWQNAFTQEVINLSGSIQLTGYEYLILRK
jgi:glycosidase